MHLRQPTCHYGSIPVLLTAALTPQNYSKLPSYVPICLYEDYRTYTDPPYNLTRSATPILRTLAMPILCRQYTHPSCLEHTLPPFYHPYHPKVSLTLALYAWFLRIQAHTPSTHLHCSVSQISLVAYPQLLPVYSLC